MNNMTKSSKVVAIRLKQDIYDELTKVINIPVNILLKTFINYIILLNEDERRKFFEEILL